MQKPARSSFQRYGATIRQIPQRRFFFLKNRLPDRWRDVQDHNINQRTLKSPEECLIEIRKDILDLQKDGYLTHIIAPALPAPKKKPNGR